MITRVMDAASQLTVSMMGGNLQSQMVMVILGGYGVYKIRAYYKETEEGFEV